MKFTNVQEIAKFTNAEQEAQDVRMLRVKDQQLYWIWLRVNGKQIIHSYLQRNEPNLKRAAFHLNDDKNKQYLLYENLQVLLPQNCDLTISAFTKFLENSKSFARPTN